MEDVEDLREALGDLSRGASDGELNCLIESVRLSAKTPWKPFFDLLSYITGINVDQGEGQWSTPTERAVWTYMKFTHFRKELGKDDRKVNEMRSSEFVIWHGRDKSKKPLCWVRPALCPNGHETVDLARCYQTFMDEGCELADSIEAEDSSGAKAFSVVYDRRGMGFWKSRDNASECRRVMTRYGPEYGQALLDMYFCRFGEYYILGASWVFWAYWKVSRPFILPKYQNKMQVLSRAEDLLNYMDISEVPEPWYSELTRTEDQS